jgi:hypothetical protein
MVISLILNFKKLKTNPMRRKIRFKLITDFKNGTEAKFLNWWAGKTHHKHMICRTPAFFRNNLICAVKGMIGNKFVTAAGMIACLDEQQREMYFEKMLVVELCSNFVHPSQRGKNRARNMIVERTEFALQNNYLPIIVTQEPKIIKIISDLGWVEMRKFRKYDHVVAKVRYCKCEREEKAFVGERCEVCPFLGRSIWVKQT